MSNIVERLRETQSDAQLMLDAADEIERLREFIRSGHGEDAFATLKEIRRWEEQ